MGFGGAYVRIFVLSLVFQKKAERSNYFELCRVGMIQTRSVEFAPVYYPLRCLGRVRGENNN